MKILIFGKNGQVGTELMRSCAVVGEVVGFSSQEVNFTDFAAITKCIQSVRPNVVINAAAYTNVEKAESEEELANIVNGDAVRVIGEAAKGIGAKVIHYSTDYVFDGKKETAYLESDTTNPINAYGRSKLKGEILLKETGVDHIILRISWVYSNYGNNFYKTMRKLGTVKTEISIVSDQFGSPTWSRNVADITAQLCSIDFRSEQSGIYHVAPQGQTSWFSFGKKIFENLKHSGCGRDLIVDSVSAISSSSYKSKASRPKNSWLDSTKFEKQFGLRLPSWESSLQEVINEYAQIVGSLN